MPFLATLLGLPKWMKFAIAGVLAVALVGGALALWLHNRDSNNREIGATEQREADLRETLERTEKANEASEKLRRDPDVARAECLQNARNPDDC